MVHRIFDSTEINCRCILEIGDSGLVRSDVLRISREEAVVDTEIPFKTGARLEVILQFDHTRAALPALVVDSGHRGLRLRWDLYDAGIEEEDIEAVLMEAAGLLPSRPQAVGAQRGPASSVRIDGELDIEATLRSRARMVDTANIGARAVRVVDLATILTLIKEAVDDVLERHHGKLGEAERDQLIAETEKQFAERLKQFEDEKQDLEARTQGLEGRLGDAQQLLEEERQKVIRADQFMVSNAGIIELEQRMGRMLDRSVAGGNLTPEAEEEMRRVLARLLDDERDKMAQRAEEAQGDRIDLLERKVSRLVRSLGDARKERDSAKRRAIALEEKGVSFHNVYEPGLEDEDPFREEKLALLQELINENQTLREHMTRKTAAGAE